MFDAWGNAASRFRFINKGWIELHLDVIPEEPLFHFGLDACEIFMDIIYRVRVRNVSIK